MSKLTRAEAAKLKGVTTSTLRRWEAEGKLIPERTANGHRRYDLAQLLGIKPDDSVTIGYARVSSQPDIDYPLTVSSTGLACGESDQLNGIAVGDSVKQE